MRILLVNTSERIGGAAVACNRLMFALKNNGIKTKMLVRDKQTDLHHVIQKKKGPLGMWKFVWERIVIWANNLFSKRNLFKVSIANTGYDITKFKEFQEADIIHLHWVNQGMISLRNIQQILKSGKPVVWTMHDMWECTGVCHHAYECDRYKTSCGHCMYLKSNSDDDLSHRIWKKKLEIFSAPNLHFVAVSNWLAGKCQESSLLGSKNVAVIPNTIAVDEFTFDRRHDADFEIPQDRKVMVMGAARLDDPVKGFPILLSAIKWMKTHKPQIADKLHLVLFGDIRDASLLLEIDIPFTYLGRIPTDRVKKLFANADLVLSSSFYETLPGTLIEGMAAGCVPVTFGNGGQGDIVEHMRTGYIARYKSHEDFACGIEWAINAGISRESLHNEMKKRFSPTSIVEKYLKFINKIQ